MSALFDISSFLTMVLLVHLHVHLLQTHLFLRLDAANRVITAK
jgi:hypothetical protein